MKTALLPLVLALVACGGGAPVLDLATIPSDMVSTSNLGCYPGAFACSCSSQIGQTPNADPCGPEVATTAICCAAAPYPDVGGECICRQWGCDVAMATDTKGCACGLSYGAMPSCKPSGGVLCCASTVQPSCFCEPGRTSCPSDTVNVLTCELATTGCGAGYAYPKTVARCR